MIVQGVGIGYIVAFSLVLAAIGYIDYWKGIIPNKIVFPAAAAAVVVNSLLTDIGWLDCLLGGLVGLGMAVATGLLSAKSARASIAEAMGGGDLKLFVLIGLIIGWPIALPVLMAGIIFGGLVGAVKAIYKASKTGKGFTAIARTETAPLAPFLCLLAVCWLVIPIFL